MAKRVESPSDITRELELSERMQALDEASFPYILVDVIDDSVIESSFDKADLLEAALEYTKECREIDPAAALLLVIYKKEGIVDAG